MSFVRCPVKKLDITRTEDDASSPAHTNRCRWSLGNGTSLVRASNFCSEPPWNVCTTLQLQPPLMSAPDVVATPASWPPTVVSSHIWNRGRQGLDKTSVTVSNRIINVVNIYRHNTSVPFEIFRDVNSLICGFLRVQMSNKVFYFKEKLGINRFVKHILAIHTFASYPIFY